MARPVYSTQLTTAGIDGPVTDALLFEASADYVTVVRDIQVSTAASSGYNPNPLQGFSIASSNSTALFAVNTPWSRTNTTYQWQGRYVMVADEELLLTILDLIEVAVTISGYLLTP